MGHTAHSDLPRKHMNDKWLKWWWSGLSASLKWRIVTRRPPTTGPTTQHAMSVSELPVEDEEEPGQCEVAATWDKQDHLKRLGKRVNIVRYTFLLTVMASNLLLFIEFLDGKHMKKLSWFIMLSFSFHSYLELWFDDPTRTTILETGLNHQSVRCCLMRFFFSVVPSYGRCNLKVGTTNSTG